MTSSFQTLIALGLVALAAAFLLRSWFRKKKSPGCGSTGECGAISPEVKKLQSRLKG
ncbi:MAG TPA: FeoB-associated Cys-rich membrane protein [Lacunisphaera sp.]|nr:FeoB-associated Cys-rich membrane protein [Lacunisphaera sp.]